MTLKEWKSLTEALRRGDEGLFVFKVFNPWVFLLTTKVFVIARLQEGLFGSDDYKQRQAAAVEQHGREIVGPPTKGSVGLQNS